MTDTPVYTADPLVERIFGVVLLGQTYKNLAYLLLSYPLSIIALVLLSVGFSLSLGLAVLVVGFVILLVTLALTTLLARGDRALAGYLLEAHFPRPAATAWFPAPLFQALKLRLNDPAQWKILLFMILRVPYAIVSFVSVIILAVPIAGLLAPFIYRDFPMTMIDHVVSTSAEANLIAALSLLGLVLWMHVTNLIATGWRLLSESLL